MTPQPNTFVKGSCFDEEYGLFAIEDDSIDHIVTDPPYAEYVHEVGAPRQYHANDARRDTEHTFHFEHFTEEDMIVFSELAVRICRGWILIFTDLESIGAWRQALDEAGAARRNTLVWTKQSCAPNFTGNGPAAASEAIVTAWAGSGASVWNAGGSYGHYHYAVDTLDRRHKTQKPLPLMRQLLLDFTKPGDLVLDPFAGGGSTLVAAKQLHRRFLGYELAGDEDTERAFVQGCELIRKAKPLTRMQQLVLHKERRKQAYAGKRLRNIAAPKLRVVDLLPPPPVKRPAPLGYPRQKKCPTPL